MKLDWRECQFRLKVAGCWADGEAGTALRRKLLARSDSDLRALEFDDQVVALGSEPPWVEGAVFIGRVGRLYLPTLWEPSLPLSWIEAKLERLGEPPWLLLRSGQVLGLSEARVVP